MPTEVWHQDNKGGGRKLQRHIHHHVVSATALSHAPHILHFRNVVYARSLSEMCAARRDMVQVAYMLLRRAYSFCSPGSDRLPVTPQMFRCRGGGLSRAHSVGSPPCTPRHNIYKFSFLPRTIIDWNSLSPHSVDSPSIDTFRARITRN